MWQACEKARRVLSANAEAHLAIDCLVGETDVQATLRRPELEELAKPRLEQLGDACRSAIAAAGVEGVDAVEMVGGCSRMPSLVAALQDAFKVKPSRSLNADESVARGAAFVAAMGSASFKMVPLAVSEHTISDWEIHWDPEGGASRVAGDEEPTGAEAGSITIPRGTTLPAMKR